VSDSIRTRTASEATGWLNTEGPLSTAPVVDAKPEPKRKRAAYLSVTERFNLEHQCRILTAAFGACSYLVGSAIERPDYRDVDIRCILNDPEYDAVIGTNEVRLKLLNTAMSEWLAARTGLPIDFQFQRMTQANDEFNGERQFVGVPFKRDVGEQKEARYQFVSVEEDS
jgi:hypothetical protein